MRNFIMDHRRSLIVHYGVLCILGIALFIIGYRAVTQLTSGVQQTQTSENVAAPMSSGAALVQPPQLIGDFTLTDHTGQPLSLSDLRGQPELPFFWLYPLPGGMPAYVGQLYPGQGRTG